MPIFAYKCANCSESFESLESYIIEHKPSCPKCASSDCQRDDFNKKAPSGKVNGASAANNYGLKPNRGKS